MENPDLNYICTVIGNLCGIPIRLFHGGSKSFFYFSAPLARDPMELCREEIFSVPEHVGYFVTPAFDHYGIVNAGEVKLVIGPARQIPWSAQELRTAAFDLDVPADETEAFVSAMGSIVPMPLESVIQVLCAVNYILTGEKLGLRDVTLAESEQARLELLAETRRIERGSDGAVSGRELHNTMPMEGKLMDMVEHGNTAALEAWAVSAPAARAGIMAADQLRQMKNTFIVTATLVSRAAIRGGLDPDDALSLSDAFIQQCELLRNVTQITNLQYRMVLTFAQRVERLRMGLSLSPLAMRVANYVQRHLSERITAQTIADALYLSRPYLSAKFKEETGVTLTDFILGMKTEEAKRLLRFTDKSLTQIAAYLGFSSQSHFSRVFKAYAGATPKQFRAGMTPNTPPMDFSLVV